jgi:hypothetical protein
MMITDLFLKAELFSPYLVIEEEVLVSLRSASTVFLDLLSLALSSNILKPSSLVIILAEEDFPMPGGPESMQAFALTFGRSLYCCPLYAKTYFFKPL